ncbi:MAG: hypothetical protein KDA97_04425, partial [Acidimicrobiales bacterium]|nr:hypothetical protein [Acidimicrobiales bacterium]
LAGKAVERISVGRYTACAVTTDDVVACWGWGSDGQIGNGATDDALVPTSPTLTDTPLAGATIDDIASGDDHTCV